MSKDDIKIKHVTRTGGNVFAHQGFDPEEAEKLGTKQPRLNDVLKGRIEKCTVDRLVNMLTAVSCKVHLNVSHAA